MVTRGGKPVHIKPLKSVGEERGLGVRPKGLKIANKTVKIKFDIQTSGCKSV